MTWAFLRTIGAFFADVWKLLPPKVWGAIACIALLVGYHLYEVHAARVAGREEGAKAAQTQCAAEKKAAQDAHDREVKKQEDENRAREQEQETELAIAGANYQKELQDAEDQRKRDVAAARAGALKLRVAGMCPNPSGDRATPAAPTAAGRGDDPAGAELPAEITRRLLDIAADADRNTRQLSACQAVVDTYQKGKT